MWIALAVFGTPMGHRTVVPDAEEVLLHELKAVGQCRLVMVLRSAGEDGYCPTCGQPINEFADCMPVPPLRIQV
jgi:hypothetical protein